MPENQLKKLNIWYGKIENQDQALKILKSASYGYYFLAGLQILLGLVTGLWEAIIEGIIFGVLGFLLYKYKSRIVAIILVVLGCLTLISTFYNLAGGGVGGTNVLLAVIIVWVSVRSLQATKLFPKSSQPTITPPPTVKTQ